MPLMDNYRLFQPGLVPIIMYTLALCNSGVQSVSEQLARATCSPPQKSFLEARKSHFKKMLQAEMNRNYPLRVRIKL